MEKTKILEYQLDSKNIGGFIRINKKLSIDEFSKYFSEIYSKSLGNSTVNYENISGSFRHNLDKHLNQADFKMGKDEKTEFILMGSWNPQDTMCFIKYGVEEENIIKLIKNLDELSEK